MSKFDYQGAKSAGYSDQEIASFLSGENPDFDVDQASKAGYSIKEISDHLNDKFSFAKDSPIEPLTKENENRSFGKRVKEYFTSGKLGEAAAQQIKTGGFAGAPTLTPEQAKIAAKEVANWTLMEGIAAAYAPIIGIAQASEMAPGTLTALTRLTQGATTGAALATENKLLEEGEFPSQDELVKEGLTWMAIDGALQLAHLGAKGGKAVYDFGKAVNSIAESEGIRRVDVIKKLWESTKNYLSQTFGRTVKFPENVTPADVRVLEEQAAQIENQILPPPGSVTPEGVRPDQTQSRYHPEEPNLTAPEEFLMSDYELAEQIREKLSPLSQEMEKGSGANPRTIDRMLDPVSDELDQVSPHRVNHPNFIARETERIIKDVSEDVYKQNSILWDRAQDLASNTLMPREELASELRLIASESPSHPAGGEAKLQNFAQDLLDKLERRRGRRVHYRSISNEDLIKEIKQARVGYDYRYSGGVQGHRIYEFINAVENELIRTSSSEERAALLSAREASRNWATWFKHPSVIPFRNKKLSTPQSNYQRMLKPDTYNIISEIMENHPKGNRILSITKRNMLERLLEPYLLNPKSFNPLSFERDMAKLQGIIPEGMVESLGRKLFSEHEKSLLTPEKPKGIFSFANITETQIGEKLGSIQGLRQLKAQLSHVPGGKELYEKAAKTFGIDLLFGGQMDIPAKSQRIEKLLNDRNGRPYLIETLGKENVKVLDDLVRDNQLEKRLMEIQETPELMSLLNDPSIITRGTGIILSALRGNFLSAIKQGITLQKAISKKMPKELEIKPASPDIEIQ